MSDILVVKSNLALSSQSMNTLKNVILKQKESGVICLPYYCDVFVVPEDTEIKIEGGKTMNENQEATVFKGLSNKSSQ